MNTSNASIGNGATLILGATKALLAAQTGTGQRYTRLLAFTEFRMRTQALAEPATAS